ncbi:MAG: hypothetical protein V4772_07145 [Pseudomonadota bacterium]
MNFNAPPPKTANTATAVPAITPDTLLFKGGKVATTALSFAAGDIEHAANEILQQARIVEFEGFNGPASLIRTLASRVLAMNSVVISHYSEDDISLKDGFRAVFGTALGDQVLNNDLNLRGTPETSTTPEADFMAGVQLGCTMLGVAESLRGSTWSELNSQYRPHGMQQNNFALQFLQQVIANPELVEGFAAVLSCAISTDDDPGMAPHYAELTYDQIHAPGVGTDADQERTRLAAAAAAAPKKTSKAAASRAAVAA